MYDRKSSVAVCLIAFIAFVCGYQRTAIEDTWAEVLQWFESTEDVQAAPRERMPTRTQAVQAEAPAPLNTPEPAQSANENPYMKMLRAQQQRKANGETGPTGHWGNAKKRPFGGTLDSIQQKKIRNHQTQQRNLYFEKLSEQMKAMRGGENPTVPAPDKANPPTRTADTLSPPGTQSANQANSDDEFDGNPDDEALDDEFAEETEAYDADADISAAEDRLIEEEAEILSILSEMNQRN